MKFITPKMLNALILAHIICISQTSCSAIFETTIAQSCLKYIMTAVTTSVLAYSQNCLKQSKAGMWCQRNASISSNYQRQSCLAGACLCIHYADMGQRSLKNVVI